MLNWKIILFISLCYLVKESISTSCSYEDAFYSKTKYKYCVGTSYCCGTYSFRYCCYDYSYVSYVSDTLSGGIVAAIVIGCLVPIAIIVAICACVCCAASRRQGARGVVVTSNQAPTVTTVNTSSNNLAAPPPYPGQQLHAYPPPGQAYGVQSGFAGQTNPAYPQYPEPGKY